MSIVMNKLKVASFLFLLLPTFVFSKAQLSITLIVNDTHATPDQLKSMVNLIYFKSGITVGKFTVSHLTGKHENTTTWTLKKKNVDYKPVFKDCEFSLCGYLNMLISSNKVERNKFYNCNSNLTCDANTWGLDVGGLPTKNESAILDKIQDEITLLKKSKTNTSIFFYLADDESNVKPTVTFEKDTIEIKAGELFSVRPIYSKSVAKVEWSPTIGLSCSDCKEPNVSLQNNNTYFVAVTDSSGCKNTLPKAITLKVKKSCLCTNETLSPLTDLLNSSYIKFYTKLDPEDIADYRIEPLQAGWVFEFVTKPNCGSNFNLTVKEVIKDKKVITKEETVWEHSYERKFVTFRRDHEKTRNIYSKYPDAFFFRLELDDANDRLAIGSSVFKIQIDSFDDENNTCQTYTSPTLKFAQCDK